MKPNASFKGHMKSSLTNRTFWKSPRTHCRTSSSKLPKRIRPRSTALRGRRGRGSDSRERRRSGLFVEDVEEVAKAGKGTEAVKVEQTEPISETGLEDVEDVAAMFNAEASLW